MPEHPHWYGIAILIIIGWLIYISLVPHQKTYERLEALETAVATAEARP